MQPHSFPATPLDLEMHSWEVIGAGEFAPAIQADFAHPLDAELLDAALKLLVASEPVLGCCLIADGPEPHWQPLAGPPPGVLRVTEDEAEYERLSMDSPRAAAGPQISALLRRRPDTDRLLLKITHAAGDGAALLYCLERLAYIYSRLADDPDFVPEVNTARRDLGQVLQFVPRRAYLGVVRDWFKFALAVSFPKRTHNLGLPMAADRPWHYVTREVDTARVSALSQYGRSRGATLNDLFLAAFYRALVEQGRWDGKSALRALCTVNLRSWLPSGLRAEAVCNLSSGELPFLGRQLGVDFEDTLGRVTSVMQQRKRSNPGLAVALLCPKTRGGLTEKRLEKARGMFRGPGFPIFTNAGRIDPERLRFTGQEPIRANFLTLKAALPKTVVAMSGYKGTLTLSFCAADSVRPAAEAFLDEILNMLPV